MESVEEEMVALGCWCWVVSGHAFEQAGGGCSNGSFERCERMRVRTTSDLWMFVNALD